MRKDYLGFVTALQAEHPDIAHLQVFNEHFTHVFHPQWVRQILVDQADALIRWERATQIFSLSMGQSVLVTEGAMWQRQRRILHPGFTPKRVTGYSELMIDAALDGLRRLEQSASQEETNIEAWMTQTTMDMILRALFGRHQSVDTHACAQAIQTLSHYAMTQLFRPFSWPLWLPLPTERRVRAAQDTLNQLIDAHIHFAIQHPARDGQDLLTMMLNTRDPEQPDQGLSRQEIHDQSMVIFQAGHETTATALTWWCGLIAQHKEVALHVQQEVDEVLQGDTPTPENVAKMPWLQASLKETLRLYPPAAILFTRRARKDITVGPWTIPKGEMMTFTPYVIQRDPRWFDSPHTFLPARFLPHAQDIERGAWMPFGTGPRVCIGQHFAMLEMSLIAAMLMQRFELSWPQNQVWPSTDLAVTLRPASPMRVRLTPRH